MGFFPVPRDELPTVHVSESEYRARKLQMHRMLEVLVDDYEMFTEANSQEIDTRRWKSIATRGKLKLYKERNAFDHTGRAVFNSSSGSDTDSSGGYARMATRSADSIDSTMSFSEEMADAMRMTLMVGECAGRMENAMYATIATTQTELSLVDIFLHEDVADCAVLHTMEGPTEDDPYHFLGYKWFVRKSPTSSHLVSHRDSVYLEVSGLTKTRSGQELGYHIMHSVDLVDFPLMRERNCIRSSQSIRALYHQRPGNIVEVYIMGNIEVGGMLKGPIAGVFIQETLFNMPKLIDCGEAKRLTKMLRDSKSQRDPRPPQQASELCMLCRQPKKMFGAIAECDVCGLEACGKCRLTKRVYQHEGILGRFYKVACCKTCVLRAKTPKPAAFASVSTTTRKQPKSSSVRSVAEHLERRRRAGSSSGVTASTSASPEPSSVIMGTSPPMPAGKMGAVHRPRPPATSSTPHVPIYVGSSSSSFDQRSRLDSNMSTASSSSYYTPVASPMEIVPMNQPGADLAIVPKPTTRATPPPPPPAPQASSLPSAQAEMFRMMQELQMKAQAAYNTTQQNQRFIDGRQV